MIHTKNNIIHAFSMNLIQDFSMMRVKCLILLQKHTIYAASTINHPWYIEYPPSPSTTSVSHPPYSLYDIPCSYPATIGYSTRCPRLERLLLN